MLCLVKVSCFYIDKNEVDVSSHEVTSCLHSKMLVVTFFKKNYFVEEDFEFGTLSV